MQHFVYMTYVQASI